MSRRQIEYEEKLASQFTEERKNYDRFLRLFKTLKKRSVFTRAEYAGYDNKYGYMIGDVIYAKEISRALNNKTWLSTDGVKYKTKAKYHPNGYIGIKIEIL